MSIRYPIIFTELCFLCEQFVNHGVHKLHILRFRLVRPRALGTQPRKRR